MSLQNEVALLVSALLAAKNRKPVSSWLDVKDFDYGTQRSAEVEQLLLGHVKASAWILPDSLGSVSLSVLEVEGPERDPFSGCCHAPDENKKTLFF